MAVINDHHDHFQGRSRAVMAVTLVMICLSSIFVFFRMLSRSAIVKRISVDDYFMVLAWLITVGLSFTVCYGAYNGLGRNEDQVPAAWQETLEKADYAFTVLYQPALMATKTSILAFYLTLSTANRNFKWACYATLFVVNAGGLALTLFTVFQCTPVDALFKRPTPPNAHCTDILTIYLSSIPLNIITDLAILLLPIPVLTAMKLPKKQKIILLVTFGFGIFVAVVDVVRIVYLQSAAMTRVEEIQKMSSTDTGSTRDAEQTDSSWYLSLSFMWSAVEVNVGIMCACVPGLKPLVARFLPSMLRGSEDFTSMNGDSISSPVTKINEVNEIDSPNDAVSPTNITYRDFGRRATEATEEDGPMDMLDFLTTPDDFGPAGNPRLRPSVATTNTTLSSRQASTVYFDFIDMKQQKPLVQLSVRESIYPIGVVTVVFFIWGFEYGLLNVLNSQFQSVANVTPGQTTAIHSAYFAGYFFGPIVVGRLVLKHWGFNSCFPIGLSTYAAGLLIFWPSAVLTSWVAFLITNFIVGFGLSLLEVSANAFITLCGPAEYGEMRLNLSQGFQAIGSIVAPLIADKAFFHKSLDAPSLINTQWAYLGMSIATVLLAVGYYYLPLPEVTDSELEEASERIDGANKKNIGNVKLIWITLALGAFSQMCYVGGQEVNATEFNAYLGVIAPSFNQSNFTAVAHTAFAVSRFLAAGLGYWVKPRIQLLVFYMGAVVFQVLSMNTTGATGVAMIIMVFFMEGPLFSLIFAQALRGMGKHTRLASVVLTSAIGGGGVFSPISNQLSTAGRGPAYSLVIAVAAFAAGTLFPVGLNASRLAHRLVDPVTDEELSPRERTNSTKFLIKHPKPQLPPIVTEHKEKKDVGEELSC